MHLTKLEEVLAWRKAFNSVKERQVEIKWMTRRAITLGVGFIHRINKRSE
jgi:hypothetical protein